MANEDKSNNTQSRDEREIQFLQTLRSTLQGAKQELNNDLTRLAIRNLPMMIQDDSSRTKEAQEPTRCNLSQSTDASDLEQRRELHDDIQVLEPLDLDPL